VGVVVMMMDSKMETPPSRNNIRGTPDVIASPEFRLSYNMLLNVV
jgi:superfamily II RNA helicase